MYIKVKYKFGVLVHRGDTDLLDGQVLCALQSTEPVRNHLTSRRFHRQKAAGSKIDQNWPFHNPEKLFKTAVATHNYPPLDKFSLMTGYPYWPMREDPVKTNCTGSCFRGLTSRDCQLCKFDSNLECLLVKV